MSWWEIALVYVLPAVLLLLGAWAFTAPERRARRARPLERCPLCGSVSCTAARRAHEDPRG